MTELFPNAAPSFDDPLGLLRACHERILRHCDTLLKLAEHLKQNGADEEARKATEQIHHYFSTAGKHHHQDEEVDVFSKLIRQSLKMADMIHALKKDHAEMDRLWDELEPLLKRPASIQDLDAFTRLAQTFSDLYRKHIEVENNQLLALAQHILSSKQLKEIGSAMAERRGIKR